MAVKNEIGNRYGRLLVIKRAENNHRGDAQWLCKCDCGNEVIVKGISLRSGHTKSCGCLQREKVRETGYNNTKNLLGKRFGYLTVIDREPGQDGKQGKWICLCDCGSITKVSTNKLISGHTMSCGCLKSKGEFRIGEILTKEQIEFSKEYTFPNLKSDSNNPLRFDFALFNDKKLLCLIEYDGIQHYDKNNTFYTKELEINDKRKNLYCEKNNIILYRIKYNDNIEEKIKDIIKENFKASE